MKGIKRLWGVVLWAMIPNDAKQMICAVLVQHYQHHQLDNLFSAIKSVSREEKEESLH